MVTVRNRGDKPYLGELLLSRQLITKEQLDRALRMQAGGLRRLGHLLVMMKLITEAQLLEASRSSSTSPSHSPRRSAPPRFGGSCPDISATATP